MITFKLGWPIIEQLMEQQGVRSRDALAAAAGVHKSSLYKISKGHVQPSLSVLSRICGVLRCHPGDVLQGDTGE